ncbi:von Willebrand factor d and egf domain-containing protein [Plakobranchus ocellatus]|uniref:von Willebrand factor d and egf domain-containing protein n=1 Tax=Plakobranchus ocellatus TaxID=259542 RepID=A0AAV4BN25_9GAST|nr:von Willebrand factor d and egf domain-containing protein [Plakobranchus ocellatus]
MAPNGWRQRVWRPTNTVLQSSTRTHSTRAMQIAATWPLSSWTQPAHRLTVMGMEGAHWVRVDGNCECEENYFGTSCEISRENLTPPLLRQPEGGAHMCEVDSNSECSSVFISGSNFFSSSELSCHIRQVEMTETGVREPLDAQTQVVQARLIARDRVRCDLGERTSFKRTLRISVSNDRVTTAAQYQLFVAYDPVCYRCDPFSCTRQTDVCVIGNACVKPGDFSVYDDCLYCDLQNPTEWTVRKEVQRCREKHAESDDSDDMLIPLVGTGCALLLLLIILVIGLIVFLRRRDAAKKRESRQTKGHSNLAYNCSDGVPFDGSPVLHMNVREDAPSNNLTASNYPEEA